MRGLGDIDPEPVCGLLEDVGWDVTEAFARICGGSASTAADAAEAAAAAGIQATNGRRRGGRNGLAGSPAMEHSALGGAVGGGNFSTATRPGAIPVSMPADEELELLRLQQEEYDRVFADEDGR